MNDRTISAYPFQHAATALQRRESLSAQAELVDRLSTKVEALLPADLARRVAPDLRR